MQGLIVEIHDINPAEMPEVLAIYRGLLGLGIERPALRRFVFRQRGARRLAGAAGAGASGSAPPAG